MAKITIEAGVNTSKFRTGLAQMRGDLSGLQSKFQGLGTALLGGGLVSGLAAIVKKGDDIGDMAQRFGVSAEMLQRLGVSAEFTGTSMETVARGLQKMQANGMAADSIYKLADAVAAATTENEAFAIAEEAVGVKMAGAMLPMLKLGGDEMRRLGETASIMSDDVVSSLSKAQDEIFKMKQTLTTAFGGIAGFLAKGIEGIKVWSAIFGTAFYAVSQIAGEAGGIIGNALTGNFGEAKKSVAGFGKFVQQTLTDSVGGFKQSILDIYDEGPKGKARLDQGEKPNKESKVTKEKETQLATEEKQYREYVAYAEKRRDLEQKIKDLMDKRATEAMSKEERLAVIAEEKSAWMLRANDAGVSELERLDAQLKFEELTTEQLELQAELEKEKADAKEKLLSSLESATDQVAQNRDAVRSARMNFSVDDLQRKGGGGNIGTGGGAAKELDVLKKSEEHLANIEKRLKDLTGGKEFK